MNTRKNKKDRKEGRKEGKILICLEREY